jgi:hypothetical protein
MRLTVLQLIQFLRNSVKAQDPNVVVGDSVYLKMSDDDIKLYLEVVVTRDYPKVVSLELLPNESVYPVIMLAKKELYFALASSDAPLIDMGADNNNYLKQSQRFDHYMKLIVQVDTEYNQFIKDGGVGTRNTLTSYEVLLSDRFYTNRNHELGLVPILTINLDNILSTAIEISWQAELSRFLMYRVYISEIPILDEYNIGKQVSDEAVLIATVKERQQSKCRISGLLPATQYYVLVSVTDRSSLTGYAEVQVTTLA